MDTDRYQWLQVDLGSRKQVVAIATQGRYSSSDWTSKYRLLYSDTQKNWRPYLRDGNIWVRNNVRVINEFRTYKTNFRTVMSAASVPCWLIVGAKIAKCDHMHVKTAQKREKQTTINNHHLQLFLSSGI